MTRDRQSQHLDEPPDAEDLKRFPSSRLTPAMAIYRLHRRTRRPWYFSSSGAGRFDLPNGTCYAAFDPAVAFIEVFYGFRIVSTEELVDVVVSTMEVEAPSALRLADCTNPRAAAYGVTSEINTTVDYALTQRWAAALREAGFDGVCYWARHDPGRGPAVALFGPAGQSEDHPEAATQPVDPALQADVTRRYGIVFLDTDV